MVSRICRRFLLPLLLAVLCGGAGGAGQPSDLPTTRIVSLVPALTETLFAIGAEEQVVGVSSYCSYPPEAQKKPRAGALLNPAIESVVLLKPTLVLLYPTQSEFAARLGELGISARMMPADRIRDLLENIDELGRLTGRGLEARALRQRIEQQFQAVRERSASQPAPRTLVVVSRDATELRNLYVSTPDHYLGELLNLAGGRNVVPGGAPAAISKEQIVRADPEVILDFSAAEGAGTAGDLKAREESWRQLTTVRAIRAGRMSFVTDPHALIPGPRAGETAAIVFELLHGKRQGSRGE